MTPQEQLRQFRESQKPQKSPQELLKELSNKGIVSCKEVSFRIFGFSLATLNFLVNIALILFYSLILKYEK